MLKELRDTLKAANYQKKFATTFKGRFNPEESERDIFAKAKQPQSELNSYRNKSNTVRNIRRRN